jgi:hypothetical protein
LDHRGEWVTRFEHFAFKRSRALGLDEFLSIAKIAICPNATDRDAAEFGLYLRCSFACPAQW